jgi:hypothetical protein
MSLASSALLTACYRAVSAEAFLIIAKMASKWLFTIDIVNNMTILDFRFIEWLELKKLDQ